MYEDLLTKAVEAAQDGGRLLMRYFRGDEALDVRSKGRYDFVSRADRESEEAIVSAVLRSFPEHSILGEEGGLRVSGGSDYQWVIDPLDGTTNFLQGLPVFCVSIACREGDRLLAAAIFDPAGSNLFTASLDGGAEWNGRPMRTSETAGLEGSFLATGYPWRARSAVDVYLEAFREVFHHARSIRRCGSAALDLAYTAAGVYDGFFEFHLSAWDLAAGALLVREAGGAITDVDGGQTFLDHGNVVAGGAGVHPELLAAIRRFTDEELLARLTAETETAAASVPLETGGR